VVVAVAVVVVVGRCRGRHATTTVVLVVGSYLSMTDSIGQNGGVGNDAQWYLHRQCAVLCVFISVSFIVFLFVF